MGSLLLAAPAIPLDEGGRYVAAAYIVFVVLLVIYVGIMAARLGNLSKEIESLAELAERRPAGPAAGDPEPVAAGEASADPEEARA
jgi:hypothetical protein